MFEVTELSDTAPCRVRLRPSSDRRLVVLELLSRELRNGVAVVLHTADVSARWQLDPDTANDLLDHLSDEGLLGRREDGLYVAQRRSAW